MMWAVAVAGLVVGGSAAAGVFAALVAGKRSDEDRWARARVVREDQEREAARRLYPHRPRDTDRRGAA
jgi:hypothetical protein